MTGRPGHSSTTERRTEDRRSGGRESAVAVRGGGVGGRAGIGRKGESPAGPGAKCCQIVYRFEYGGARPSICAHAYSPNGRPTRPLRSARGSARTPTRCWRATPFAVLRGGWSWKASRHRLRRADRASRKRGAPSRSSRGSTSSISRPPRDCRSMPARVGCRRARIASLEGKKAMANDTAVEGEFRLHARGACGIVRRRQPGRWCAGRERAHGRGSSLQGDRADCARGADASTVSAGAA